MVGLGVGVLGTALETTPWTPIGLALFGAGLLGPAWTLRQRGRAGLAWVMVAISAIALLGAIDRVLTMLPLILAVAIVVVRW